MIVRGQELRVVVGVGRYRLSMVRQGFRSIVGDVEDLIVDSLLHFNIDPHSGTR